MSKSLHDEGLLADAQVTAGLFTDDLIAADKQLDVMGGSAGAILGLLRLYRDIAIQRRAQARDKVRRASASLNPGSGPEGRRCWSGQGSGPQALNGMSHGAAGFAYALASLAAATGRDEFATAASECIAFENSSFDAERNNWPDLRGDGEPGWPCQWCHGAPGIGLARIAMTKRGRIGCQALGDRYPKRACGRGARLARPARYALLWHAGQRRILLRGRETPLAGAIFVSLPRGG